MLSFLSMLPSKAANELFDIMMGVRPTKTIIQD